MKAFKSTRVFAVPSISRASEHLGIVHQLVGYLRSISIVYLSTLCVLMFICLFVYMSVCQSVHLSICLNCISVYPSTRLSVYLSVYLSVCLSICLSYTWGWLPALSSPSHFCPSELVVQLAWKPDFSTTYSITC